MMRTDFALQGFRPIPASYFFARQRIAVVMPMSSDTQNAQVFLAQQSLIFPMNEPHCRKRMFGRDPGEAYSTAIDGILRHPEMIEWEYLLTMEEDILPGGYDLLRLCGQMQQHPQLSAVAGVDFRPREPDPEAGLVECFEVNMGFTLFRLSMFRDGRLRRPWFSKEHEFWSDAHRYGYRCAIDRGMNLERVQ